MKNYNLLVIFFLSIFLITGISGCFLFGTKGIFDKSSYKIVKLEIDNKVLLSPQELAHDAKERLGSSFSTQDANRIYESRVMRNTRLDSINAAFEELRSRSVEDDSISQSDKEQGTSLGELVSLTMESTFNLDRSQDTVYGKAGCNDYTAKFFWQDEKTIVISGVANTRKLCKPKEVADFENNFVRNLDGIYAVAKLTNRKGYVLNNGRLRIYVR